MGLSYKALLVASATLLPTAPGFAETITFEDLSPGLQAEGSIGYPGVTFTSTSGAFSVVAGVTGQALCAFQGDCGATLVIDFASPASNVRFTYADDDAASALGFQGETTTAGFRGLLFAAGNPFTQDAFDLSVLSDIVQLVVFTNDPGGVVFDNFSFTTSATGGVPEPATWGMMIAGVGAAGAALRRRNQVRTRITFA